MFREFILPLTSVPTSIFNLLVNNGYCDSLGNMLVSSVKNSAIIPERVSELTVFASDGNTGQITLTDNSGSGSAAQNLSNMSWNSNRNSICLRDYLLADSTGGDSVTVQMESV